MAKPRPTKLVVAKNINHHPDVDADTEVLDFEAMRGEIRSGRFLSRCFRYREAVLLADSIEYLPKPLLTSALIRLMARRSSAARSVFGATVTWPPRAGWW